VDPAEPSPELRIDKWLWAVRVYKTRSLATEACRAGHVKVGGKNVKAARTVRIEEVIVARAHEMTRTVKVLGLTGRRVGAKMVSQYMEDLTPPEEYERLRVSKAPPGFVRLRGVGRPTKKDRRAWSNLTRDLES